MTLKTEAGKVIRKARKEKKMTMIDLSEKSKVEFKYLGKIERGTANTTLDLIERLATSLDKKVKIEFE